MTCQILLSRTNKRNMSKCRLLKFLPSMQSEIAPITTAADVILIFLKRE